MRDLRTDLPSPLWCSVISHVQLNVGLSLLQGCFSGVAAGFFGSSRVDFIGTETCRALDLEDEEL